MAKIIGTVRKFLAVEPGDITAALGVEALMAAVKKMLTGWAEQNGAETIAKLIPPIEQCRGELNDVINDIGPEVPKAAQGLNDWFADMLGNPPGRNPLTNLPYTATAENRAVTALSMLLRAYGSERREEFRQMMIDLGMMNARDRETFIERLVDDRLFKMVMGIGNAILGPVNDQVERLNRTLAGWNPSWLRR